MPFNKSSCNLYEQCITFSLPVATMRIFSDIFTTWQKIHKFLGGFTG